MHLFKLLSIVALPFAHSLQITPKQNVPDNASPAIDPQFLGFGIEAASVPDYTGTNTSPSLSHRWR